MRVFDFFGGKKDYKCQARNTYSSAAEAVIHTVVMLVGDSWVTRFPSVGERGDSFSSSFLMVVELLRLNDLR